MIDYHVHTSFSDGEESVENVVRLAASRGITSLAITDHFDPFDPGASLKNVTHTADALALHFDRIRRAGVREGVEVFCGIETCTGPDGRLRLPEGVRELCDLIITSPHYVAYDGELRRGDYFADGYWEAYKRLLLAQARGEGDVLGHPEGYLPIGPMLGEGTTYEGRKHICADICARYLDAAFVAQLADALAQSGKACELHGATGTPRESTVRALAARGVRFSPGSDAHAMNLLGQNDRAMALAARLSLRLYRPRRRDFGASSSTDKGDC